VSATAGLAVLAALAAAALASQQHLVPALIAAGLLVVVARAPRWRLYAAGALVPALFLLALSPLLAARGYHVLWQGPHLPVLGPLGVTWEEVDEAALQALRLAAVGLAFAAYALLLDHDRLVGAARFARRSVLLVALATRLAPTLERDADGYVDALRGRGVAVEGLRGRARLLSPLVAGSLERGLDLAEAMEARGFGRPGATRIAPQPWRPREWAAVVAAVVLAGVALAWL
jgi:energy-coupling factor transport system permease protein